jgi:tRNA (adenine22-N1)-methyltransferase
MNLSKRIQHIADMIPECNCLADIGTDHAYVPISTTLRGITKSAIACDINEGPIKVANSNIKKHGLINVIETRIGPGLSVLKEGEADVILIAGMGGNLIVDILKECFDIAQSTKIMILQPVQYPEVLRKFLIESGFSIVDEELVKEDDKYYQIIKTINKPQKPLEKESYYYIGEQLINKKHPLLKEFLEFKLRLFNKILHQITLEEHPDKFKEVITLKKEFEDVIKCL